jgi:hypothetical protein
MDEQGMAALLTEVCQLLRDRDLTDAELIAELRRLMAQANGEAS